MKLTLNETLVQVAHDFGLVAKELIDYAAEDTETGWDHDKGAWPVGSLWRVEGQVLYALIRALKPTRVLELGTLYGCSATHMLMALKANRNDGHLTCVDKDVHGVGAGSMIPARLKGNMEFHNADMYEWIKRAGSYGLIFSDGGHDSAGIQSIWNRREKLLNPGGIIVEHDALHFLVGSQVMAGITNAGASPFTYLTAPSDCGLAIWQREAAEALDYATMDYNALWTETGPRGLDMRDWIRDQTGSKRKPNKAQLVKLVEEWNANHTFSGFDDILIEGPPPDAKESPITIEDVFIDENGDG